MIYDDEEDILSFSKGKKVKSSIDIGDFVIDIDGKGFVTGIEILNASENLSLTEGQLKSLEEASLSVTYRPRCIYIHLSMRISEKEKDVTIPLTLDLGHRGVMTENTSFAAT